MIKFILNGEERYFSGNENISLLQYLRLDEGITSVKDGCSAQSACGACMVEINGEAKLSCVTLMKKLDGANITTMEGIPDNIKKVLGKAFVEKGGIQCGFCTPGFLIRTKVLFQENPNPSRDQIIKALNLNLCRCTGYVKIIDSIEFALKNLNNKTEVNYSETSAKIGKRLPKYQAYETAIGERKFLNDIKIDGMLYSALKFSDYPRAKIKNINIDEASKIKGVIRIVTSKDIPGDKYTGLILKDWPLMISEGETTRYIGDVLAGVIAETEEIARKAVQKIKIEYEELQPVCDPYEALKKDSPKVHPDKENLLENCIVKRGGNINDAFSESDFIAEGIYETQRIEHAFLEVECAIAYPTGNGGIELLSQTQGIYEDRRQISGLLGLNEDNIRVILVPNGGGFGGKEDMTVQGHVSLFAYLSKKPVKLCLSRDESIIMHPKRHPVFMEMKLSCDKNGMLKALKLRAVGDTGAYASVGTKVMERVAGHAAGGYYFPVVDLESKTVYTNNIPSGAMRGFGVNQVAFPLERCIDELCEKGGFDRWKFRYDNALINGSMTATGQILKSGVAIRETLLAVKDEFYKAKYSGLACGIKNCGVGNGMWDFSDVIIEIISEKKVIIKHGWTEMGQGIQNMAIQTLCEETGIPHDIVDVIIDTKANIKTGMTTSSRATSLLGNAIIEASKKIKEDLKTYKLADLSGKNYFGRWVCDWTTKPGKDSKEIITHYSYSYATQLVILNDKGEIDTVVAAHDAGKIMNPTLFEGQIEGAVIMGIGYAMTEDLPMENSKLKSTKLRDCQVPRAKDVPKIIVKGVEVSDPHGPYGAKGIGEIGMVPTAAAIANALYQFDKIKRYKLPLKRK